MTAPVWGCPWHGRVQGGQLTLPDGEQMAWPTLNQVIYGSERVGVAESRMLGDTSLVQVPGILPPERTEDELADDTASGRQWWGSAVLSGAVRRIHGKATNGWIYCDPDGGRWRVQAPRSVLMWNFNGISWEVYHANRFSGSLTLTRFGDLAGSVRNKSLSFAVEDLTLGASFGFGRSGYMQLRTVSPDGSRAIYALVGVFGGTIISGVEDFRADQTYFPQVFVEITLSGYGDSITASAQVVRDFDQVMGRSATEIVAHSPDVRYFWLVYTGPAIAGDDYVYQATLVEGVEGQTIPPDNTGYGAPTNKSIAGGDFGTFRAVTSSRRIMALWYSPGGLLRQLEFEAITDRVDTGQAPVVSVEGSYSVINGSSVSVSKGSNTLQSEIIYTARLLLDGVPLVESSLQRSITQTMSYDWDTSYNTTVIDSFGGSYSSSGYGSLTLSLLLPEEGLFSRGLMSIGERNTLQPYEHSNHCWSIRNANINTMQQHWSACATPAGAAGNPESLPLDYAVLAQPVLHGSWCPVTNQVARSTNPVCWT